MISFQVSIECTLLFLSVFKNLVAILFITWININHYTSDDRQKFIDYEPFDYFIPSNGMKISSTPNYLKLETQERINPPELEWEQFAIEYMY